MCEKKDLSISKSLARRNDMKLKNGNVIMFLCDKKACGEVCPNEACSHTGDIDHTKNFDFVHINDKLTDYFEMEPVKE